jgi:hypothetical protein
MNNVIDKECKMPISVHHTLTAHAPQRSSVHVFRARRTVIPRCVNYIFLSFSKFETRQEKMELKNITEKIVEEAFAKKFAVLDEIKNNTYTKW